MNRSVSTASMASIQRSALSTNALIVAKRLSSPRSWTFRVPMTTTNIIAPKWTIGTNDGLMAESLPSEKDAATVVGRVAKKAAIMGVSPFLNQLMVTDPEGRRRKVDVQVAISVRFHPPEAPAGVHLL